MDEVDTKSSGVCLMKTLPVELVGVILLALPDVSSLQAAVISCPLLYHAFLEAEEAITAQVLSNQIDASVLPEAMAAFESSRLRTHETEAISGGKRQVAFLDIIQKATLYSAVKNLPYKSGLCHDRSLHGKLVHGNTKSSI